jgi:hypothetical protein
VNALVTCSVVSDTPVGNRHVRHTHPTIKKRFTIGGAIAGCLYGVGIVVSAFVKAPGAPGKYELMVLAFLVGILAAIGAFAGLLVGWIVSLCVCTSPHEAKLAIML